MGTVSDQPGECAVPYLTGSDDDLKELLCRRFPEWNIVLSSAKRWWAFRLPAKDDLNRTSDVDADTPAGLYLALLNVDR